jgi:hypothetical protein
MQAAFVRPSNPLVWSYPTRCIQLTDRRVYFTWDDSSRRQDIPMFEDADNSQELPPPITPISDLDFVIMEHWSRQESGYSFTKSVSLGADSDISCSSGGKPRLAMLSVALTLL